MHEEGYGVKSDVKTATEFYEAKDKQTSAEHYQKACEYGKERARGRILPADV